METELACDNVISNLSSIFTNDVLVLDMYTI